MHLLARTEFVETVLEWVAREPNFLITTSETIDGWEFDKQLSQPQTQTIRMNEHDLLLGYVSCKLDGTLSGNDIHQAEIQWIQDAQHTTEANIKFKSWRKQFGISEDSTEIWQNGARLQNADITYNQTHPVLLDKDRPFTRLVVVKAHSAVHNNGVKDTLAELPSKFWVVQGRYFVRTVVGQCRLCRRLEYVDYATQPSPPLPDFCTTMDYFSTP